MKNINLGNGITSYRVTVDANNHIHLRSIHEDDGVTIDMDMDPTTADHLIGMLIDASIKAIDGMLNKAQ